MGSTRGVEGAAAHCLQSKRGTYTGPSRALM